MAPIRLGWARRMLGTGWARRKLGKAQAGRKLGARRKLS